MAYWQTVGVSATNVLTYTFGADGSFQRESASTVSGTTDPDNTQASRVDASLRETANARGTYQFRGNTLELVLNGGQKLRLTAVMLFPDLSWLVLNGRTFRDRNAK